MLKEMSVQGCTRAKHKIYRPLDDLWLILSTSKAFDYWRARRDKIRFAFDKYVKNWRNLQIFEL